MATRVVWKRFKPGDVWRISHDRNTGDHLAPYPRDLVRRAITLTCPPSVCSKCNKPRERIMKRGLTDLNTDRQARRALEIYEEHDELTEDHIRAIQAVGISDAGKAEEFQVGAGENDDDVQRLAKEAKRRSRGYFRSSPSPSGQLSVGQNVNAMNLSGFEDRFRSIRWFRNNDPSSKTALGTMDTALT